MSTNKTHRGQSTSGHQDGCKPAFPSSQSERQRRRTVVLICVTASRDDVNLEVRKWKTMFSTYFDSVQTKNKPAFMVKEKCNYLILINSSSYICCIL